MWCCEIWLCVLSSEIAGAIAEIDESEDVVNLKCRDGGLFMQKDSARRVSRNIND